MKEYFNPPFKQRALFKYSTFHKTHISASATTEDPVFRNQKTATAKRDVSLVLAEELHQLRIFSKLYRAFEKVLELLICVVENECSNIRQSRMTIDHNFNRNQLKLTYL